MNMKKLLSILVLSLLFGGSGYAEILGVDKTVNDYVDNDYTIVSVNDTQQTIIYTLRSNAKSKPLVVTCVYSIEKDRSLCFAP